MKIKKYQFWLVLYKFILNMSSHKYDFIIHQNEFLVLQLILFFIISSP